MISSVEDHPELLYYVYLFLLDLLSPVFGKSFWKLEGLNLLFKQVSISQCSSAG
tara:strand:- start:1031 stop:1192 length:162 start_codon:yes stop_codon:yes gene_type:complete